MHNSTQKNKVTQIKNHKTELLNDANNLSLNAILCSDTAQTIMTECREYRERIYTPMKTTFTFIKQVLSADKSCKNAVAGLVAEQICVDTKPVSTNSGPYCKARERLPEEALHGLVQETGRATALAAPTAWNWDGRAVKLVDGTTITMPDTPENQETYPQHGNQKEGVGFPIARLVAVMSLGAGTVLDYAMDAHKGKGTGEHSLFRQIINCIEKDDILLGDSYYPSFF